METIVCNIHKYIVNFIKQLSLTVFIYYNIVFFFFSINYCKILVEMELKKHKQLSKGAMAVNNWESLVGITLINMTWL